MNIMEDTGQTAGSIDLEDPSTRRKAQLTKALGHPVRLAILKLLGERDTCFCGDFTEVLPLAQSTVSQHLKVLKESGLITGTNQGVRTCYCLDPNGIQELHQTLVSLIGMFDTSNLSDCC
ncbi:MAG: metalloregulator ArsR/SmtB family transcription factor [Cyclonatronaceae bacterium]